MYLEKLTNTWLWYLSTGPSSHWSGSACCPPRSPPLKELFGLGMLTIMTNMGEVAATLLGLPTSLGLSLHQEGIRALLFTAVCGAKDISQCRCSLSIGCTLKLYLALDNVQVPEIDFYYISRLHIKIHHHRSSSSALTSWWWWWWWPRERSASRSLAKLPVGLKHILGQLHEPWRTKFDMNIYWELCQHTLAEMGSDRRHSRRSPDPSSQSKSVHWHPSQFCICPNAKICISLFIWIGIYLWQEE